MSTYTLTLTETERECGVTLEDVQRVLPKALVMGDRVILPADTAPAVCSAVARCVFAGQQAGFVGHDTLGQPVYRIGHGV